MKYNIKKIIIVSVFDNIFYIYNIILYVISLHI